MSLQALKVITISVLASQITFFLFKILIIQLHILQVGKHKTLTSFEQKNTWGKITKRTKYHIC